MSREEKRERERGLGVLGLIALMAVAVRSAVNPKRKTILDASDTNEITDESWVRLLIRGLSKQCRP